MENIKGLTRTGYCAEYDIKDIGKKVVLMGWVNRSRNLGSIIFCDMRDRTGLIQVVFREEKNKSLFNKATNLKSEYVIAVTGIVNEREDKNPNIKTGDIEIEAEELRILSESAVPAIDIAENTATNELMRLKYRYLDLRKPKQQYYLIMRNKVAKCTRDFFSENGFIEVETPVLTRSTPEGARDYLVPSRVNQGKFYALPQSPQLLKQLLMISGLDRYYQIVKCFRDEDLRANRQPEFTQIDLEMSFVDVDDVIAVNEKFIKKLFKETLNVDVNIPFARMTYEEAMNRFGSDKPDLRYGMELTDISELVKDSEFKVFSDACKNNGSVRGINAKGCADFSRKDIDKLTDFVKDYRAKGLAWLKVGVDNEITGSIVKFFDKEQLTSIVDAFNGEENDLILIIADRNETVFDSLGALRTEIAKRMNLADHERWEFLWVTEFPLLEFDEETNRYYAKHHPFTSPMDEDIPLLHTHPEKVRAKAYDIVLNGEEIGGGSIRIHDSVFQEEMLEVLGFTKDKAQESFGFLLNALKYGAPPHGGMAYGLDRLVMSITKTDNIRDVIAFPKIQSGACPLTDAPNIVEKKQLDELGICLKERKDEV
ncbi:MAG TPA: aspartate--tRNA ligase [Clostridia bacterium]|nr:aspartate--tRNA ligase [Clostridiaceae bacterium]HOF25839.1 aspartate--tRNA ligase [Clostridia bacterium]HOM33718.1 aspartate--tRNA ligase [Clostridia bacterium]HOR88864.1 aspartate--tRNA ligase [Clostridia bacterium]HOT70998.1 aspartate--tRNA ligase [Clostridia bacterium]